MATQIQLRRDTESNWSAANPVLAQGEIGINLSSGGIRIGNGNSEWNSLQEIGVGAIPFDQSLNTTDDVAFDSVSLANGTRVQVGSFDNETGGANGIGLLCAVGYELNWQGGRLRSIASGDNSGSPLPLAFDSPLVAPSLNFGGGDSLYDDSGLCWGSQAVAMRGDGLSNFSNDAGFIADISGQNLSTANNDAGFITGISGQNLSEANNDAWFITDISGQNLSQANNDAGFLYDAPADGARYVRQDGSWVVGVGNVFSDGISSSDIYWSISQWGDASLYSLQVYGIGSNAGFGVFNGETHINGSYLQLDAYSGTFSLRNSSYETSISLSGDGSASFSGAVSIGNPVSSSTDNSVDSKVEIVINGTTYYLLAFTSAS